MIVFVYNRHLSVIGTFLFHGCYIRTIADKILNGLFAGGAVSAIEIAQIGQYAENVYYGKPSGLMDQMASSVGNIMPWILICRSWCGPESVWLFATSWKTLS